MKYSNLNKILASLLITSSLTTTSVLADAAPDGSNDLGVAFAGIEGRANLRYGYAGTVISVDGHDLGSSGWIVKAIVGYGEYKYNQSSAKKGYVDGKITNAEIELGHEFRTGDGHLFSVLVGPDYQRNKLSPKDATNKSGGDKWGAQIGFEFITDPSKFLNVEFDASVSTANRNYNTRLRPGVKWGMVRLGPEASFSGSRSHNEQRGGLFATAQFDGWSASLHGGLSSHRGSNGGRNTDPYIGGSFGLMY